jgi:hypothetical protein
MKLSRAAILLAFGLAAGGYTRNSADARVDFTGTALAGLHPGALVIQPLGVWTVAGTVRVPLLVPNAWDGRESRGKRCCRPW